MRPPPEFLVFWSPLILSVRVPGLQRRWQEDAANPMPSLVAPLLLELVITPLGGVSALPY